MPTHAHTHACVRVGVQTEAEQARAARALFPRSSFHPPTGARLVSRRWGDLTESKIAERPDTLSVSVKAWVRNRTKNLGMDCIPGDHQGGWSRSWPGVAEICERKEQKRDIFVMLPVSSIGKFTWCRQWRVCLLVFYWGPHLGLMPKQEKGVTLDGVFSCPGQWQTSKRLADHSANGGYFSPMLSQAKILRIRNSRDVVTLRN